jgi:hypothetical protein
MILNKKRALEKAFLSHRLQRQHPVGQIIPAARDLAPAHCKPVHGNLATAQHAGASLSVLLRKRPLDAVEADLPCSETKRNETKRNETKRYDTIRYETADVPSS